MFRTGSLLLLLTASLAALPAPEAAAQDSTGTDPLQAIVAEALHANLGLRQERLAERRSASEVDASRALLLPSISLEARFSRFDGVPNVGELVNPAYAALNQLTGSNRFPTDIDLTLPQRDESHMRLVQPILNEAARAQYALARARHDGQRAQLATAARALAADAQTAYLLQASARRVTEIFQSTLAIVRENERVAERLLAAGRATPEAVLRARAERAQVEQELAEAREHENAATRAFNLVLQRPLDAAAEVIPDSAFDRPLAIGADAAVAHGLAAREELQQTEAGVRTAQAAKRVATAGFMPSLAVALDYGFQGREVTIREEDHVWTASLVASWSLYNGGADLARRAAADEEVRRLQTSKQELADRIALQVRNAHEAAAVAHDAIATAGVRLEAAQRTFALVRRRFEEGSASPYELVEARSTLTRADLNRVLTLYRYAMRRVDLERAAALRDVNP